MIETTFIEVVQTFGIQTAMLIWFMFRTESILKNNTKAINELTIMVAKRRK